MSLSVDYSSERDSQHSSWKAARARMASAGIVKAEPKKAVEKVVEIAPAEPVVPPPEILTRDWLLVATPEAPNWLLVATPEATNYLIGDITKEVCAQFNISRNEIESIRRNAAVAVPRHVAMMLAKHLTMRSLPEIGRRIGGRDHTTVLHACRKWQPVMDACAEVVPVGAPIGVWVEKFRAQIGVTPTAPSNKYRRKSA